VEASVLPLDQGGPDGDGRAPGVDVAATECGEFAVAEAGERGEQDQGAEAGRDEASEVEDLGDGGDWPLCGAFGAAPLIRQGLREMRSSSTAVLSTARRSRYALATMVAAVPASRSLARQARTVPGVMSLSAVVLRVGSMYLR
jgi:hypothetical protein